jgi:hypothetical protein
MINKEYSTKLKEKLDVKFEKVQQGKREAYRSMQERRMGIEERR